MKNTNELYELAEATLKQLSKHCSPAEMAAIIGIMDLLLAQWSTITRLNMEDNEGDE